MINLSTYVYNIQFRGKKLVKELVKTCGEPIISHISSMTEWGKNPCESRVACHEWQMGNFTHPFLVKQVKFWKRNYNCFRLHKFCLFILTYCVILLLFDFRALTCLSPSIRTSSLMKKIDTVQGCYAR